MVFAKERLELVKVDVLACPSVLSSLSSSSTLLLLLLLLLLFLSVVFDTLSLTVKSRAKDF